MSKTLQWAVVLATLLLVVGGFTPVVNADHDTPKPEAVFPAPYGTDNTITGLAVDSRARNFAVVTNTETTVTLPTQSRAEHVYLFDARDSGQGLMYTHRYAASERSDVYREPVVAFAASSGSFVVGGPGNLVSYFQTSSATPKSWELPRAGEVRDVAITADGQFVVVGLNPSTSSVGRIYVYDATRSDNMLRWDLPVRGSDGSGALIHTLETSRQTEGSARLVIGHSEGLTVVNVRSNQPENPIVLGTSGAVTAVDVSPTGSYVLAGTTTGCFYLYGPDGLTQDNPRFFNRCGSGSVTAVAMDGSGERFAVGTSNGDVLFWERVSTSGREATQIVDPRTNDHKFTLQGPLVALDYDATGRILLAASENEVAAFHESRVSRPIWHVRAGPDFALNTPLKGAAVADDGERFIIAGRNNVAAFRTAYGADVAVESGLAREALPGSTVRYTLLVENTGSAPDTYSLGVTPPAAWDVERSGPITVLPGETRAAYVNVTAPLDASPGSRDTRVRIESLRLDERGQDPVLQRVNLNVTITRDVRITVESSERTLDINQGQEEEIPFTIRNLGNAVAVVNLTEIQNPSRGASWGFRFDTDQVTVRPGDAVTATAVITAPPDGRDGDTNRITIRASVGRPATFASEYTFTARVNPEFNMDLSSASSSVSVAPARTGFVALTVTNLGNTPDRVNLTVNLPQDATAWHVTLDQDAVNVPAGGTRDVTLGVRATDRNAADASVTVTAVSEGSRDTRTVTVSVSVDPDLQDRLLPAPGFAALLAALAAAVGVTRATTRPRR